MGYRPTMVYSGSVVPVNRAMFCQYRNSPDTNSTDVKQYVAKFAGLSEHGVTLLYPSNSVMLFASKVPLSKNVVPNLDDMCMPMASFALFVRQYLGTRSAMYPDVEEMEYEALAICDV